MEGRGCAPVARHSPSHDAAAGGARAERALSTKSEVSVETGKAWSAQ